MRKSRLVPETPVTIKYAAETAFASMENIKVDEGEYDLIPFLTINQKNILPFWVEVKKL